ncbi:carbohydrate deacetylase [Parabacteroides sp.]|uniref:carbohydrate deacetylase n=1 Tax=Parabacteroides sp. TaxID=1869337 RepID=UPI0026E07A9D|nr:ChbG/HpnK family deacetylase [Parabacteroides sp.]MDO5428842.1 ChbG/HpnK family deacetylase [Parabacteroides sp.]
MKVILHADDFGFDKDTLDATIECFERGALTSCSVMVNCEASEEAFDYARKHPMFSYGVHLMYVDGLKPVLPVKEIASLVDEKGVFLPSNDVRKLAVLLRLPKEQIMAESQAQIDKIERAGVKVSHLDSHGHLHKFPSFLYAMKFLKVGGVPVSKVRGVQNVFVNAPSWKSPNTYLNRYFRWYLDRNFMNPTYFYMSANSMDTFWADSILRKMDLLPQDSVIEIGVHPGHREKWRQLEFDDILDLADKIKTTRKHQLVNWNEIRS